MGRGLAGRAAAWAEAKAGVLDAVLDALAPFLDPLERWEISQPGNILRVFERGGGPRIKGLSPGTGNHR